MNTPVSSSSSQSVSRTFLVTKPSRLASLNSASPRVNSKTQKLPLLTFKITRSDVRRMFILNSILMHYSTQLTGFNATI